MNKLANFCFRGKSSWLFSLGMLALVLLLFETIDLDMMVQRHFYSPERGWLIQFDRYAGMGLVYYTLINILLALYGGFLLFSGLWIWFKQHRICWRNIYLLICLIVIPIAISVIKDLNTMPYPRKIQEFGGKYERHTLIQAFKERWTPGAKHHRGWPAGHASGSCSLIALAFAFSKHRHRWLGFAAALLLGGFSGLCHTMDGNHFISHTLVTFFIAWIIAAWLYLPFQSKIENTTPQH